MKHSRRDFIKQACVLVASSGASWRSAYADEGASVVAETAYGKIRGTEVDGIKVFKGVPYGATTAGANRFMPPQPPGK
jgi:para-nitrobenzyl esterase